MPEHVGSEGARPLKRVIGDELRFFRTWLEKPLLLGAVSPSGKALVRRIASKVDPSLPGTVVELGPGTGVVTAELLRIGVAPQDLVVIEYDEGFARGLVHSFPGIGVVQGDAYALTETLAAAGVTSVATIISGLPLFTKPKEQRRALLEEAMALLPVGGHFVQFSYAMVPPVPDEPGRWTLEASDWVMLNIPPARVWTYRKL